ncbi:hypothetical protein CDAR_510491 [Caerostris darwini]|uniref:Uncharacterized protein n=1 Tax=Caerostris darwini TaxID=1538125 RepID=A0AAV4TN36_9ARAC|nr:hypothetical protein CDAR_510491 [Caerostris darwini]
MREETKRLSLTTTSISTKTRYLLHFHHKQMQSNINYSPRTRGCRDRRIPTSYSISLQGRRSWGDEIPPGQQWSLTNTSRDNQWAFRGKRKEEGVVLSPNWTLKGYHSSSEHRSVHISEAVFIHRCSSIAASIAWVAGCFGFLF